MTCPSMGGPQSRSGTHWSDYISQLSREPGIALEELVDVAVESSVWASLLTQDKCLEDESQAEDTNYKKMINECYSSHSQSNQSL